MNIHLASSTSASGNLLTKSLLIGLSSFKRIPPNIFYSSYLYLGNISHHVEKEFIHKHLPDTMFGFIHVTKNLKKQLHFKYPQQHLLISNVVHKLKYSCGSFHIGHTRRSLAERLDEHQTSLTSEVCNHSHSNPNHRVDFNNPQILTSSPYKSKRLILESLYIQQLKPSLNLDSTAIPIRVFNI